MVTCHRIGRAILFPLTLVGWLAVTWAQSSSPLGSERAVPRHLQSADERNLPLSELLAFGRSLFTANWTDEDGAGRPFSKGTGQPLNDRSRSLTGARAFNRISGPDANSCQGCHLGPYQLPGGGGDFVGNAVVMADRFDFVTFDRADIRTTRGAVDERGHAVTLKTVGNSRLTPGLWGAGYIEMLARQMTADLRRVRDGIKSGQSGPLVAEGVSFGRLARRQDGSWDVRGVQGLPRQSLIAGANKAPDLTVRPWRRSGSVTSLREMTNTSFNEHLGIQSVERFGAGTDPDGDGVVDEMTRADVTAVVAWEATLPVPGRMIPSDAAGERLVVEGERLFDQVRCTSCHIPALPLRRSGWIYSEGRAVSLIETTLPQPRLAPTSDNPNVIMVPAYTDLKLHDITDASDPDAAEAIDINAVPGTPAFTAGNRKFLTARLWGAGSRPAYFHDGLVTSLREAVVLHSGEALATRQAFERLTTEGQNAVLAFLRSLQVLPPGAHSTTNH